MEIKDAQFKVDTLLDKKRPLSLLSHKLQLKFHVGPQKIIFVEKIILQYQQQQKIQHYGTGFSSSFKLLPYLRIAAFHRETY